MHTIRPWRNCSGTFSCSANWRNKRDMVSKQLNGRCLTSTAVQLSGPALPAPLWALACNSMPLPIGGVTCLSNDSVRVTKMQVFPKIDPKIKDPFSPFMPSIRGRTMMVDDGTANTLRFAFNPFRKVTRTWLHSTSPVRDIFFLRFLFNLFQKASEVTNFGLDGGTTRDFILASKLCLTHSRRNSLVWATDSSSVKCRDLKRPSSYHQAKLFLSFLSFIQQKGPEAGRFSRWTEATTPLCLYWRSWFLGEESAIKKVCLTTVRKVSHLSCIQRRGSSTTQSSWNLELMTSQQRSRFSLHESTENFSGHWKTGAFGNAPLWGLGLGTWMEVDRIRWSLKANTGL